MSSIRLFPLRHIYTRRVPTHCLLLRTFKYESARKFTTTHVCAEGNSPFSDSAMKALRDSKLGQAIFSNPELQKVVMEMWQVSKEEGIDPLKPSVTALLRSSRLREQMKKLSVVMQSSGLSPADLKEALDAIKAHQDPAKKD